MTPDYFDHSEEEFRNFLKEHGNELKSEFFIPLVINNLIVSGKSSCRVLDTPSDWFGVTYAEDRPEVVAKIQKLVDAGVYPSRLFQ